MKRSGCCYGYVRVSTVKQALEGSSKDDQEKKIRAWAELNDMKLMGIHIDAGVSGTFMFKRPAFSKLLESLDRGDVLVAYDISRVSRNAGDMSQLMEKLDKIGAHAVFIIDGFDTSTTMGKAMAQMASIMKGIEVSYTTERTKESYQMAKEAGRALGMPPYGWKKANEKPGSGLVENPEQQAVIVLIRKLRDEEKMSFNAIANKLTVDGIPTPRRSSKWNDNTVKGIYHRKEVATKGRHDL